MTTNERAEELADTLRADGNLSMRFLGIFKTKIEAALRAQREEALEEAARACMAQADEDQEKYRSASVSIVETKYLSRSCGADDCVKRVRALKTQTGGGNGNNA